MTDMVNVRERLAEIAAAVEFAPGDGFAFRESSAVKLAEDLRALLASEGEALEALGPMARAPVDEIEAAGWIGPSLPAGYITMDDCRTARSVHARARGAEALTALKGDERGKS